MLDIYLVRHGQTAFNLEKRVQGVVDVALTQEGRRDATALGLGLQAAGVHFDAAYSSDLTRAVQTADLILASVHPPLAVTHLAGLREENYGKFEGELADDQAMALFGLPDFNEAVAGGRITLTEIADRTFEENMSEHPNKAESAHMVITRFDHTMQQIADTALAKHLNSILVVAHGTVAVMWLNSIGYPVDRDRALKNASVTQLGYQDGRFVVNDYNDLQYVTAGRAL